MKKAKQALSNGKQKPPDTLRLPEDLKVKIKEQAERENRSFSNMIITILREYYTKPE